MKQRIIRNAIVYVRNPIAGRPGSHIMRGNHYAVVCQNDFGNTFSGSIIVCYITSKIKRLDLPVNVLIQFYKGLRNQPAIIKCSQLMTVDRGDILSVVDHLRPEDIIRFDSALRVSLDLPEGPHAA